ncbi:YihY/virulence factor BrkB family protein [Haloglomus salinum]|uniref:YihY/virulence factor BrkB family protein n=1 Tax=Haloglomus salinum TaxID=2962673 RepID=UPI0020C9BCC2|nr:YihY/virulence factor BrkB family protein [Haloglomus salinum]
MSNDVVAGRTSPPHGPSQRSWQSSGWYRVSGIGDSLYASTSQSVQLYGVAGGVLLLLTWMYVVGMALPVGTILNVVVAEEDYGVEGPD